MNTYIHVEARIHTHPIFFSHLTVFEQVYIKDFASLFLKLDILKIRYYLELLHVMHHKVFQADFSIFFINLSIFFYLFIN